MDKSNLESMIKKYTEELLRFSAQSPPSPEPLTDTAEEANAPADEGPLQQTPLSEEITDEETENYFSFFTANVYSGNNVYPVKNAAVKIYRNGELIRFLTTDENGKTKTVTLPSYSKENSLDPESSRQSLDYYADISAEGFSPAEKLLVSAVGGAEIVLNTSLIPLSAEVT